MAFSLKNKKTPSEKKAKSVAPAAKKTVGKGKSLVLLIGDEGAILVYTESNKVVRRLFAPTPQPNNTEAMVNLMQANPKVPIWLLIDSLDQQFVRQTFPPVSSLSVNSLVKRRLDRDFQTEDLKGFLPLGRDKTARKEWNFLLIALAKTPLLTEWIDLISELPNEFKGIYLVPVEAPNYLAMLNRAVNQGTPNPWQLIVTHNKVSGFRQVVVHEGKLVFTRVNQVEDDAIAAVVAGTIEQEILNTIEYLRRLGFADNDGLDITVVASSDINEALDLKRFNLGETHAMTPLDVADALNLEQAALSADRFGDVVMSTAFLRSKKHVLRFSTAYADSLAKLYKAKIAIKIGCALIVLALVGLSAQNFWGMQQNSAQTEETKTKHRVAKTELDELKKKVASLDENVALKSVVVSAYDVYVKDALSPIEFATTLSSFLTAEQRLQSIEWKTGAAPTKGASPAPATPALASALTDKNASVIITQFKFMGTYVDVEALSRAEEEFLTQLSTKFPNYTITHDTFPWAAGNEKGMEISFDDKKEPVNIKEGMNQLTITFVPRKGDKASGASPASPGKNAGKAKP